MKCSNLKDLLYLKEDELAPHELAAVKEHLSVCPECGKEFAGIVKTHDLITKVKEHTPFLEGGDEFTDTIMASLEHNPEPMRQSPIDIILDKVSLIFLNSAVRAAAYSFIVIIVSTFLLQQYLVFSNVTNLENKIAYTEPVQQYNASAGFNELKAAKLTAGLINLISGEKPYADITGRLILADKSKLNELLTLYSGLQNYRNLYSKEIKERYPELNEFLGKKLSIEDLQEFVKKNENMIKELSRKFPAGGK